MKWYVLAIVLVLASVYELDNFRRDFRRELKGTVDFRRELDSLHSEMRVMRGQWNTVGSVAYTNRKTAEKIFNSVLLMLNKKKVRNMMIQKERALKVLNETQDVLDSIVQ
jgi:hypothetical protein